MQSLTKENPISVREDLTSVHFDDRRDGSVIDTIVIHTMHNPELETPLTAESCKACLDKYQVSAHYLIDREGQIWRVVSEGKRAWHAGVSKMPDPADGRDSVNHFSIGIELIATETSGLTTHQYSSLAMLTADIAKRHQIRNILGHSDIAPDRKTDPWNLDWAHYKELLKNKVECNEVRFTT